MVIRIISGRLGQLVRPGVNDGIAIDILDADHDALLEFVLDDTRIWRRTERANLEKKPSSRV